MINPLTKYKTYHKNTINIMIHQVCIPLLLMTTYAVLPFYLSAAINTYYSINFLLFDVLSTKSIHSVYYLQTIFVLHLFCRYFLTVGANTVLHIFAWVLQIIGHQYFEKNTPAFVDNLYDSFLFGPYFMFIETFYPSSLEEDSTKKYTIIKNDYDSSKKSIVYFAGLFQKAQKEYNPDLQLSSYNHIYINTYFTNKDIYQDTLVQIMEELNETDIECIVGFSFGGSLALQLKQLYFEKTNKEIKTVLISPGGFQSHTRLETMIQKSSHFLYSLFCNDKWYMIQNYPTYQNTNTLSNTDYIISSTSDFIHSPESNQTHENRIIIKHALHADMINVVTKQNILSQIIKNDYQMEKVITKPLTSHTNKLLFGSHFYPYHITLWLSVSMSNLYIVIKENNTYFSDIVSGFLFSSFMYSLIDYFFHLFLHKLFYTHHKKHHIYPNKLSIIHSSALPVITIMGLLYKFLTYTISENNIRFFLIIGPLYYLAFEFTHLLSHSYKGNNKIILNVKYFHKLHHIDENVHFGFITPFWDYVLGTLSLKYKMTFKELVFGVVPFYSFFMRPVDDV